VLPFTEGEWAAPRGRRTNKIKLEPWQVFIVCVIFGWVRKSNGRRRFRQAYVKIPRKNGKSLLAGLIALIMLVLDGERSPQVYSGATTERQALEVFNPIWRIIEQTQEGVDLKKEFGLEAHTKRILCRFNGGKFQVLVRRPGDGAGASCAIIDEYHEHPTSILFDTMKQGQRARLQPLIFVITTAGSLIEGPCHLYEQFLEKVLDRVFENDAVFGIMFGIDTEPVDHEFTGRRAVEELARTCNCASVAMLAIAEVASKQKVVSVELLQSAYVAHTPKCDTQKGRIEAGFYRITRPDDWRTVEALRKANPNYGVSLYEETLLQEQQDAIQSAYLQNTFRTKTLNEWMNAGIGLVNMAEWDACADPGLKLEDFEGRECDEGADLAAKIDLASRCKVFTDLRTNPETNILEKHYTAFGVHYVPRAKVNDDNPHYLKWLASGHLIAHPGAEIQLQMIQDDIEADSEKFKFRSIGFDPWNAMQMQQNLTGKFSEDVILSIGQDLKTLSEPLKELLAAIKSGRFHHNADPVLRFSASCAIGYEDKNRNIKAFKNKGGWAKIDPFAALNTAMARAYVTPVPKQSVYEERGVLIL
jgi:phage terminase large subunit-like protein